METIMHFFGQRSGFLLIVSVVAALISGVASGQRLSDLSGPAEFPPPTFTPNQYVDSRGCVFVRVGNGDLINWVPRVNLSRDQLCGFQPTQVSGSMTISLTTNVPNPLDTPVSGLTARLTRIPMPVVPVTHSQRANVPTSSVAIISSLIGQGAKAIGALQPVAAASQTPTIQTAPIIQQRVLTRSQACVSLSGFQPNLVLQSSGMPIHCGQQTQLITPIAGLFVGIGSDLMRPQGPYSNPLETVQGSNTLNSEMKSGLTSACSSDGLINSNDFFSIRCGSQVLSSSTFGLVAATNSLANSVMTLVRTSVLSQSFFDDFLNQNPPPYSNPTRSLGLATPRIPIGYQLVWDDGRLNTQRGIREGQ
ncbi:MAG: hypothetical protein ACI9RO_001222 [Alteromonas macleodii]